MAANYGPKLTFMRMVLFVAGSLVLIPAAFAAPADEPYLLKNQTYKTSTLFTTKSIKRNANSCPIAVYKGNVYTVYARQGDERMMVAKVPLNGSAVRTSPLVTESKNTTQPGYAASKDNHARWVLAVDRSGYIHVCGGMHSMSICYWRSDRPEDISSFTRIRPNDSLPHGTQPCPIAGKITFPRFFSARDGQLFWTCVQGCGPLCSYDETTKLWTALGRELGAMGRASAKNGGAISFYYEDNKMFNSPDPDRVKGGETQRGFEVVWDSKNRMHMAIGLLNIDTYTNVKHPAGNATDILYAYSDDGGKTVFKSDGTQIQLPIRAEAGSHQGEVILHENDKSIECWAPLAVDKANRPIIWCYSHTTGNHCFRLESGRWVPCLADLDVGHISTDPSGAMIGINKKEGFTRFWNPDGRNSQTLDLPVHDYNSAYYKNTGELVWTSRAGSATSATFTIHRTVFNGVKK